MRPAAFLDRDGTLIHDAHYLADPAGVRLLPGVGDSIRQLNAAGVLVLLITNQSGIGRGYFSEEQYLAVHAQLVELLRQEGAQLDGEYHCPDAPSETGTAGCRKPGLEMFLRAAREHDVDVATSYYVGDRLRDVIPAQRLGGTAILVRSPQSEIEEAHALSFITVVETMTEAVDTILELIDAPANGA